MKKITIGLALLTISAMAINAPAYSQSVGEKTGVNSLVGAAPSTADYANMVAISDMFEGESSKLVETKGQDAKIKSFATQMIKDHTETSTELKAIAAKMNHTLPTALDSAHQKKIDNLKAEKNGKDFDEKYIDEQVTAHKNAVDLFERYSKSGENADLKAFASKHLPHLQGHLKMAQDLDK